MLYNLLSTKLNDNIIVVIASIFAFAVTFILLAKPFGFLPKDNGKYVKDKNGKRVEVNKGSDGKITGVGVVFIPVWLLSMLIFLPVGFKSGKDMLLLFILSFAMMMTGYLDDAARAPWGELIKGMLDLVLALAAAVVFVLNNSTSVMFFGHSFVINKVIYIILATALIWGSINVTNCTDGVDGLCGTVSVIELFGFSMIFGRTLRVYSATGLVLAFVLVAYLAYNWNPSKVLMGDAGSRTIGFWLAIMAMKSGHPFAFILMSMVFLFDGGLGLLKLSILRITHSRVNFLGNIRFPFHDHLKKNLKINVLGIVLFFSIMEVVFVAITAVIIKICGV